MEKEEIGEGKEAETLENIANVEKIETFKRFLSSLKKRPTTPAVAFMEASTYVDFTIGFDEQTLERELLFYVAHVNDETLLFFTRSGLIIMFRPSFFKGEGIRFYTYSLHTDSAPPYIYFEESSQPPPRISKKIQAR